MSGCSERNLDILPFIEVLEQNDFVIIGIRCRFGFLNPGFQTSFCSVECNPVTFVWRIGCQRIGYLYTIFIFDCCRHFVEDVYILFEHTTVAQVTVVLFIGHVQFHVVLVLGDVKKELAFVCMRACTAVFCPYGSILSIMVESPKRINTFGIAVDPPVQEVEMMAGFVYP